MDSQARALEKGKHLRQGSPLTKMVPAGTMSPARTTWGDRPLACSENSVNMISVFTWMNIIDFNNSNIIENKLGKILFQKYVSTGSPSH